jgi:hypothetical protein
VHYFSDYFFLGAAFLATVLAAAFFAGAFFAAFLAPAFFTADAEAFLAGALAADFFFAALFFTKATIMILPSCSVVHRQCALSHRKKQAASVCTTVHATIAIPAFRLL